MKYSILLLLSIFVTLKGFSQTEYIGIGETDTIYTFTDLHKFVGQKVIIIGKVRNSKIPSLNGVDIQNEYVRGKRIKAIGILVQTVVEEKDVNTFVANRGSGTFYHLKNEKIFYRLK